MFQFFKNLIYGKSLSGILADLESKLADLTAHGEAKAKEAIGYCQNIENAHADHAENIAALNATHVSVVTKLNDLANTASDEAARAKAVAANLSTLLAK